MYYQTLLNARNSNPRSSLDVHAFPGARRLIDGCDDLYIAAAQLARHRRVASREDAVGEVIHLGSLLVELQPALGSLNAELIGRVTKTRNRFAFGAVGKIHRPAHGLFHFVEEL